MNVVAENRIGAERIRIRETRTQWAELFQVSTKTISNWEKNPYQCSPSTLAAIACHCGCSVDYLLNLTDNRTPKKMETEQ